jgi:glycosyltransferase involved in cell wall biosynthesis
MRVAVVNNCVPFLSGGAEHLADSLVTQLERHGHRAQLFRFPFRWNPLVKISESMLAASMCEMDIADRVIGLKFPAYYVQHDTKVLWLLHQFRQVYDLWGTEQGLEQTEEAEQVRHSIMRADNRCFSECHAIYTNSPVTRDRLAHYNAVDATVLWPPLGDADGLRAGEAGDYVLAHGRVNSLKRQELVVEAMRYVRSGVRLVVAGAPETADDEARLRRIVDEHGLGDRVDLRLRFIGEDEKRDLLAGALACAYIPYDEDSYGYVTLEAFQARKPVVTCVDSGGIGLLVDHGVTGLVADPDPRALAAAFDELHRRRDVARSMGMAGLQRVAQLGITWDNVVEVLTR